MQRQPGGRVSPAHGYQPAKQKMLAEGHTFERTRDEWGFEFGIFVDGALVDSGEVVHLATLPKTEREKVLAETRLRSKDFACHAVKCYMDALHVSFDELAAEIDQRRDRAPVHDRSSG
jgi:hypothetical protein